MSLSEELADIYGSKWLTGAGLGDRKIITRITAVRTETLFDEPKPKGVLSFDSIKEELALNKTNYKKLHNELGVNTDKWIGVTVELYTEIKPNGQLGVTVRVISKPAAVTPTKKPVSKAAATTVPSFDEPWPDEAGDPGPQLDNQHAE